MIPSGVAEMPEVLLVLALVVAVVTVVGHGLWLLVAALVRVVVGQRPPREEAVEPCVWCGRRVAAGDAQCEWCGRELRGPAAAELADLAALGRQLRRLQEQGILAEDVARSVAQQAAVRQKALLSGSPLSPPVAPPVVSPAKSATAVPPARLTPAPPEAKPPAAEGAIPVAELVERPKTPQHAARPAPPPSSRPGAAPAPATPPRPAAVPTPQPARGPAPRPAATSASRPSPALQPAPPRPSRSWAKTIEAFMEERNMRWGELIGGLLFVGGGVALAVSLREKLQAIPYSQFLLFAFIAVLVYGAGLYSHYRWKLANTSRGLLVIALLLVPLSFLVMADLPKEHGLALTLGLEAVSLALFGYLTWLAARVLVPESPELAVLGVLGNSAAMLVSAWLVPPDASVPLSATAGGAPAAVFSAAVLVYLSRLGKAVELDARGAGGLLALLGTATFAMILAEGHLVAQASREIHWRLVLERLSPAVALAAVPIVAAGLTLNRAMARREVLEGYRAVGTTVTLLGMVVMLAALTAAWPVPEAILVTGSLEAAAGLWVAFRYRLPLAHAGVIFTTALVCLVGYHAATGGLFGLERDELGRAMLLAATSAPSGNVLGVLFVASAAAAELLARRGLRRHGLVYAWGCGALAAVGLSLVTWHGVAGGADSLRAAILYGVYGLVSLALAARWGRVELSYLGLVLVQAAVLWALWWQGQPLRPALLLFATAAVVAAEGLAQAVRPSPRALRVHVHRILVEPLGHAAMAASTATLPWLCFFWPDETVRLAIDLFWLGGIWVLVAFRMKLAELLAAAQVVLSLAAVAAATAWLERQGWAWLDPRSAQAYGLALALLGLAWIAARIGLAWSHSAQMLLNPPWPPVDRVVHHSLVLLQLLMLVGLLLLGIGHELSPAPVSGSEIAQIGEAAGPGAWWLWAALVLGTLAAAWHRCRDVELLSLLVLLLTVPCLVAGRFAPQTAAASALRWGLGGCFVLASAVVWNRRRLAPLAQAVGAKLALGPRAARLARGIVVGGSAGPVVAITLLAAVLELAGRSPAGPVSGSLLASIGPSGSYLVPLVLVIIGLVGYALVEVSAADAFAAGLVCEMGVVLGYLLVSGGTGGRTEADLVFLVQLATITAAAWAALWMLARRWTNAWREGPTPDLARALMSVQLGLCVAGNAVLLLPALATLALVSPWYDDWAIAAGGPAGWVALASAAAVIAWRGRLLGRRLSPELVGLTGLTALGLAACTVQDLAKAWDLEPAWGFRVLMLGWALYSVAVAMAAWWVASIRAASGEGDPPRALVRAAAVWVRVAGILAVTLGLKAAFFHHEQLWGATAIGLASVAGAIMAVWLRREGWAFAAALGVNLAASLAVWHVRAGDPFAEWWLAMVQANVIASSLVAIIWLLALGRLYQLSQFSMGQSPLLALQTALPVAGQAVLCAMPVADLLWHAPRLSAWMGELAAPQGWLALATCAAAAGWYWLRLSLGNLPHVAVGTALATATLAACLWADAPEGQAYHALLAGCAAVALATVLGGIAGGRLARADFFSPAAVQGWAWLVSIMVFALTVAHSAEDPRSPWWPGGVLLAASLALGVLAVWRRQAAGVYASGLLLNAVATIAWHAWWPESLASLLEVNALALGAASIVWSLVGLLWPGSVSAVQAGRRRYHFAHLASQTALGVFIFVVAARVLYGILEIEHGPVVVLSWVAAVGVVGSILVLLWDRSARLAVPGLYLACLTGVGLGLDARGLAARGLCLAGTVDLAGYALAATGLGLGLPRLGRLWRAVGIHDDRVHWPNWFSNAQTALVALAGAGAAWVSIDFAFEPLGYVGLGLLSGRMLGPAAATVLLVTAILMSFQTSKGIRADWQVGSFAMLALVLGCCGWSWLAPEGPAPWLHRGAVLMAASVAAALAGGGLAWLLGPRRPWSVSGRRVMPALGAVALGALVLVLGGEVYRHLSSESGEVPMALWAKLIVAAGLVGLAGGSLAMAVVPRLDPLKLTLRGRTAYVYAAEALVAVLCLHLRLVFPELFALGLVQKYWMFLVMAVAFGGAWLGEWFERRQMAVLSEPLARTALLLPLVPAVVFWFLPEDAAPVRQTMMGPGLWFLIGLFYGTLSIVRHSPWLAALAIGSGNMGLWVLWDRFEISFFDHPQLWLIPAALCALVAEYLHHDRLTEAQSAGLRYVSLAVIYVSSTFEFMRGVGESIWLPLVLVGLSVAGALAGILLRVRSFLYLGVTFLVVVLVRMIVYAAFEQGQIWVFWVFVVSLGTAILALFGLFEKRRNDVLARIERMKDWQK